MFASQGARMPGLNGVPSEAVDSLRRELDASGGFE